MFRSGVIELFVFGGNPIDNSNAWYTSTRSRRHNDGAGSPNANTNTRDSSSFSPRSPFVLASFSTFSLPVCFVR